MIAKLAPFGFTLIVELRIFILAELLSFEKKNLRRNTDMKIEIDQSGKIENTSMDTVVAFSNTLYGSIMIRAQEKRVVQDFFRQIGKPRVYVYHTFAALIFLLIKSNLHTIDTIVIDEEYPGKSNLIKGYLLREIKRINPGFDKDRIQFYEIGKKSRAHDAGALCMRTA